MKLGIILGSTRQARNGDRVIKWLEPQLSQLGDVGFEVFDLRDYPLPFFDEPNPPMALKGHYANTTAQDWSGKISATDAFIIVTPEYNHGPSAVLKNALDWLYDEWAKKPVDFISYSTTPAGGVRAVEQLRQNAVALQMVPLTNAIHIPRIQDVIDEEGKLLQGHYDESLARLLDELSWWSKTIHTPVTN